MSEDKKTEKKTSKGEAELLPHNYDGIQELDNPLPSWWLATFYITIVFGIAYYAYYEIFDGPTSDQYLSQSLEKIQQQKTVENEVAASAPKKSYEQLMADKEMLAKGKGHFQSKCAACHGQNGEGVIGPNLTDSFWMHSKGDMDGIMTAIQKGFLDKGMPGWNELIPAAEQPYLAAYVISLQGTNPANPKTPQGNKVQ